MTLQDLIDKLLGRQPASADTARQRLQLVLAHDRSDLNPELLDQMRREILEVVSRYVEIDLSEGDVSLETEDRVTALVANLPIRRTPLTCCGSFVSTVSGECFGHPTLMHGLRHSAHPCRTAGERSSSPGPQQPSNRRAAGDQPPHR